LDAELLLWLPAAPWSLGSLFGSFSPHGARSKGDQQPDGRVAHNQKLQTSLVSIQRLSPPVSCAQGRLLNETHAYEVYPYEIHTREMHACETPAHEMHTR